MSSMPEAGRVISGRAGGLRLAAPGEGTRPFADRVKQALFGSLEADPEEPLGGPFLDLFAGSGAAGIEALSRGAPLAVFVERDAGAARVVADNLRRTALEGGRVMRVDVLRFLDGDASAAGGPFSAAVVDPPYAETELLESTLQRIADPTRGWLRPAAVVVLKHGWRWTSEPTIGCLERQRQKRFGETALTWYRRLVR
jgi:16S rRNA (guanine966-N2)-methyltransferase